MIEIHMTFQVVPERCPIPLEEPMEENDIKRQGVLARKAFTALELSCAY